MTAAEPIGPLLHSYFADHLIAVKGLRPASVCSYPDTIRLLLAFTAADKGCKITRLRLEDLTFDRVIALPAPSRAGPGQSGAHPQPAPGRGAQPVRVPGQPRPRTTRHLPARNRHPDEAGRPGRDPVPGKRRSRGPPRHLPRDGRLALRDRALILFLYNTGARVQEAADLRASTSTSASTRRPPARQRRQMADLPAWQKTAELLDSLLESRRQPPRPARRVLRPRAAPDPLRHLQDHPPSRGTPRRPAHRPQSARTSSGTPPRSTSSRPASKSTSSAAGSATPT